MQAVPCPIRSIDIILDFNAVTCLAGTPELVDYLETIEYWNCPDSGFWEEGPKEVRSSSLAACIRGLENYHKKIQKIKEPRKSLRKMIELGYESLNHLLPKETETRTFDLALLSLIYPGKLNQEIVTKDIKEKIIKNVKQHLERPLGIIRYIGDTWNGKDNSLSLGKEMPWNFLSWLYLSTGRIESLLRAIRIKQKYKTMPEGIIDGKPNCTKHLLWVEAMYKLAIDKFEKENKR